VKEANKEKRETRDKKQETKNRIFEALSAVLNLDKRKKIKPLNFEPIERKLPLYCLFTLKIYHFGK
jgi:hypothetical protein